MEPFIRSDQYQFIRAQVKQLLNGHATVKDSDVLEALSSLVFERVEKSFGHLTDEQRNALQSIGTLITKEEADQWLLQIKQFVIPFPQLTEQAVKKLFPKVKKLKIPTFDEVDWRDVTYVSWIDSGSNKKYIITHDQGVLIGIEGAFKEANKKGICSVCNAQEEVGLFMSGKKGLDTYTSRGNYICTDAAACNANLTDTEKLAQFVTLCRAK